MKARAVLAALMAAALGGCGTMPQNSAATWQGPDVIAPVPSASSAPSPSPSPSVKSPIGAAMRARIPQFEAPPIAEQVELPTGDQAGWFTHIPTKQKVAFITIDDGQEKHPLALPLIQEAHVPVSLFLEIDAIKDNPGYFKKLQAAGATIQAHTISHPSLPGTGHDFQKHEICDGADQLGDMYGTRPTLFRPPFGEKDDETLRVVKECKMKAAFFWKETANDGRVWYQEGNRIQPGDIILMHFRKRFPDDFLAILKAIHEAGLTPARLEDYIP